LLLAAGLGTRLRPLTETVPKCLVPIHGKPLLDYWLDLLFEQDIIERVLVNTGHLAPLVRRHVAASRWRQRVDLVHEEQLLGTGGTVLANRGYFGNQAGLVAHGDNLTRFDLAALVARHRQRPRATLLTMMTFTTDQPASCGIVTIDNGGVVTEFHEKSADPPGDLANAAVYICEPAVFDLLAGLGKPVIDLSTELLPALMGRIITHHNADYHRDIGTPESLELAHREFPRD
jgi:mannose-1-phosphate guanylyltransferase